MRGNSKWVRSRNCGCLVTWHCYRLIAKPGNKTAAVSSSDPKSISAQDQGGADQANWMPYPCLQGPETLTIATGYPSRHPDQTGGQG